MQDNGMWWVNELLNIGFEDFLMSPATWLEMSKIGWMLAAEAVMYLAIVFNVNLILTHVCGAIKEAASLPHRTVDMMIMLAIVMVACASMVIVTSCVFTGLIWWSRYIKKRASSQFRKAVEQSKAVKNVSAKILGQVVLAGGHEDDHDGNIARATAIQFIVTDTAVRLLKGNIGIIQAERILRDIVPASAAGDADSPHDSPHDSVAMNMARNAVVLMRRMKPGADLGG
jgi:hypothetical protein